MSSRSLRVAPASIESVKSALRRNRFPSQKALAMDMGFATSTISNFLTGKPVDFLTFVECCEKLGLNWQEIADESMAPAPVEVEEFDAESLEEEDDFYIERPPIEEICYQTLLKSGGLVRIKACRGMGKTELMNRTLARLKKQGDRTASVNLLLADGGVLKDLDTFLRWFCKMVLRDLQLPDRLSEAWDENLTPNSNCTIYFEDYLLKPLKQPFVLALDNIDLLFSHPHIASDFFALLRAWHENAKSKALWKKLRLIVAHSTEVYIPLNINHSPFNVGEPIELPDFNPQQVKELAQRQGLDLNEAEIAELMNVVGGHPSLLQQAISHLKLENKTLDRLLQDAATEAGIYRNHLRSHLLNLQERADLAEAMKKLIETTGSVFLESLTAYHLQSLGLVLREGNEVRLRCELYRQYFGVTAKKQVQEIKITTSQG